MAIELSINGFFKLEFYRDETGEEVSTSEEVEILNALESGEYLIEMSSRKVVRIEDFSEVCRFTIEATDAVEYGFDYL